MVGAQNKRRPEFISTVSKIDLHPKWVKGAKENDRTKNFYESSDAAVRNTKLLPLPHKRNSLPVLRAQEKKGI